MTDHLASRTWAIALPHLRALQAGKLVASPDIWASRGAARSSGDVVVVPVMGVLTQRGGWFGMSLESIRTRLRGALEDGSSAVVLEIDSPGGEVFGVDELASDIRAGTKVKPIVAAVNSQAASAAEWLASQATAVVVTPSGEIGSIGVYGVHEDWSKALDQLGVTVTLVSAGEGKTAGHPFAPLSDEDKAEMQKGVDRYYSMFTSAVAKGRGVSVEKVRGEWKAAMYGAKEAVTNGMADAVGTLDDAIRMAAQMGRQQKATAASVDVEVEGRRRARRRVG